MIKQLRSDTSSFIVGAIVVALVITLLVLAFSPERLGDWILTLAATSISALFAVAAGIWLFNRQTEVGEKQRKQQLVEVLEAEIMDIKNVLSDERFEALTPFLIDTGDIEWAMLADFELMTFDEAVRSGLFAKDDLTQLIALAGVIRTFNTRVRTARSIIQAEILDKENIEEKGAGSFGKHNVEYLRQHRMKVLELCGETLNKLQRLKG